VIALPAPGDIWTIRYRYGRCYDIRPCVVLTEPLAGKVTVALMSSQTALYNPGAHFPLDPSDPDFPPTGLDRFSYVAGDEIHEVRVTELRKCIGRLQGALAKAFGEWIG